MSRRAPRGSLHAELPSSHDHPHPPHLLLQAGRPVARWVLRRRWDIRLHHADRVPAEGPVVYASNHLGLLDGPVLAIFSPRAAHTLTKVEMFEGFVGRVLAWSGQIQIERGVADPRAVRTCLSVLRDGHAVGVFPEGTRGGGDLHRFHHGAAYLALVSGATVVPVVMLGTREPGGGLDSTPPRGSRIDVHYGEPWRPGAQPWPRTTEEIRNASALLRERMLATLEIAKAEHHRDLPGPLPPGDHEDDPDTGFVDQGA